MSPDQRPTRTIIYGRASVDRSGEGKAKSVDDQITDLHKWAVGNGRKIVAELRDDGISASRYAKGKARPDWQRAMEMITAGEADELAVWTASRPTRDRATWVALITALTESRAMLVVDGKVHDPRDPDDGFMLDLGNALAVRESAVISKNVTKAARHRAADGRPHGPVPFGYRRVLDPETGKAKARVEHPEQAPIVREMAARVLDGETPTAVAAALNGRGIAAPRGGSWTGGLVVKVLARPAYAGLRVHRGKVLDGVTGTWPAILTIEQHAALSRMLADPARATIRNGAHVAYLVTGIARCGRCGAPCRTLTRAQQRGRVVVYRCTEKFCVSRSAVDVDDAVSAAVLARLSRPDFAAALAQATDDPAVQAAAADVARLSATLDEARRLVADERLSLASLVDLEARTLPKLEAARKLATPRHVPPAVLAMAGEGAAARWTATSVAARREIVRALVEVTIDPAPRRGRCSPAPDPTAHLTITWR